MMFTRLEALEIVNILNKLNMVPAITPEQKELGYRDLELITDSEELRSECPEIVFKGVWYIQGPQE